MKLWRVSAQRCQKRIHKPAKHLRWRFMQKQLISLNHLHKKLHLRSSTRLLMRHWILPTGKGEENNIIKRNWKKFYLVYYQIYKNKLHKYISLCVKLTERTEWIQTKCESGISSQLMGFVKRFNTFIKKDFPRKLAPVITCLGGQFGINCSSGFLKILKLPE